MSIVNRTLEKDSSCKPFQCDDGQEKLGAPGRVTVHTLHQRQIRMAPGRTFSNIGCDFIDV
jgi:hypothetical protein